jgi:hypothetical protein
VGLFEVYKGKITRGSEEGTMLVSASQGRLQFMPTHRHIRQLDFKLWMVLEPKDPHGPWGEHLAFQAWTTLMNPEQLSRYYNAWLLCLAPSIQM